MRYNTTQLALALAVLFALTICGCSGLSYSTKVAPEIQKGEYDSFFVLEMKHATVTPPVYNLLQTLVEDELVRKGYSKASEDDASVKIALFARLEDVINKSAYGETYRKKFGEYQINQQGTVQVVMFEAVTGNWLWRGEFVGIAKEQYPGQSEESKKRLEDAVAKMLREIPVRK